jgi:hypothetical protein
MKFRTGTESRLRSRLQFPPFRKKRERMGTQLFDFPPSLKNAGRMGAPRLSRSGGVQLQVFEGRLVFSRFGKPLSYDASAGQIQ